MIQRRIYVSGRVQGVAFRALTMRTASKYPGLKGYVKNLPDGRVEAVFAGDEQAVDEMIDWCRVGPPMATVIDLQIELEAFDPSLPEFSIRK